MYKNFALLSTRATEQRSREASLEWVLAQNRNLIFISVNEM